MLDAKSGDLVAGLVVALHWDGTTVAGDLLAVIEETVEDYFAWSTFYPDPEDETAVLRRLGLRLHAYEINPAKDRWLVRFKLELDAGALVRRDYDDLDFSEPGMVGLRWAGLCRSRTSAAGTETPWSASEPGSRRGPSTSRHRCESLKKGRRRRGRGRTGGRPRR
ncbi:hypothetical protein Acsp02_97120 [Actinoplanes sp. NBRC 103695]|nr:hypothetical protein Acsp02_97120 [Actinoplanes sp. NBRC 103695]